ncbi:uncharacterized protein LOC110698610 [Chenopodium quinoa]|uniref:uncharacterized protein LOC110698610 n=1 Tax=Chenopodium quinoa TaxID=63459 RepID=UPI000B76F5E5|nr:uncharacterized protein LOC110698610 [Chenopodium quinoa]
MDWYSWLSKTGLESSIVYEYGLAFAQNELEKEDISYFNHEFLQSMGITIAKHRLEILKLARREKNQAQSLSLSLKHPMAKLFVALKKTKKSLANYIATLVHRENDGRALIVLSNKKKINKKSKIGGGGGGGGGGISYSSRWKKAMMMRSSSRKLVMVNSNYQDRLMLTNGDYLGDYDNNNHDYVDGEGDHDSVVVSSPKLDSYSSPLMYDLHQNNKEDNNKVCDDQEDDEYWTPALEEIRWDAMFQDLKPT